MDRPPDESLNDRRVAQAHAEVGRTEVSRSVALALAGLLVVTTSCVSVTQLWLAPEVWRAQLGTQVPARGNPGDPRGGTLVDQVVRGNRGLLAVIGALTDQLDNESLLAQHLRPAVQQVLTRLTGAGNEQVYIGENGWLFYATDVQHVAGPGFLDDAQLAKRAASGSSLAAAPAPDPRPALLAFNAALSERGITLVLMPTPVKPSIHPEHLAPRATAAPIRNLSFDRFRDELEAAGVLLFDPATALAATRASGRPTYLRGDTHWRPEAMESVATALARFLERETGLPPRDAVPFTTREDTATNRGDTLDLLGLPDGWSPTEPDGVTVRQVLTPGGSLWEPSATADILLLGDSFANIYSLDSMGWGRGAGLAEHLSVALGRGVDRLTQNDNGAFATRAALARELARDPERLATTRVLIYQFATRELSHGDWRLVPLDMDTPSVSTTRASPASPGPAPRVLQPTPGRTITVRGRIQQRTTAPRPGTVPYRDHIIAVELTEIEGGDPASDIDGSVALVYLASMEDNVWTPAATLPTGAVVTLVLRPWTAVASEREGITRAELIEGDVVFAPPWWGELTTP
jgi:hypothetical protein